MTDIIYDQGTRDTSMSRAEGTLKQDIATKKKKRKILKKKISKYY